jgi:hypothetical protein
VYKAFGKTIIEINRFTSKRTPIVFRNCSIVRSRQDYFQIFWCREHRLDFINPTQKDWPMWNASLSRYIVVSFETQEKMCLRSGSHIAQLGRRGIPSEIQFPNSSWTRATIPPQTPPTIAPTGVLCDAFDDPDGGNVRAIGGPAEHTQEPELVCCADPGGGSDTWSPRTKNVGTHRSGNSLSQNPAQWKLRCQPYKHKLHHISLPVSQNRCSLYPLGHR